MNTWVKTSLLAFLSLIQFGCTLDDFLDSDLDYIGKWKLVSTNGILENPNTKTILTLQTNNVWKISYEARLPDTQPIFGNDLGTYSVNETEITFVGTDPRGREVIDIQTFSAESTKLTLIDEFENIRLYTNVTD